MKRLVPILLLVLPVACSDSRRSEEEEVEKELQAGGGEGAAASVAAPEPADPEVERLLAMRPKLHAAGYLDDPNAGVDETRRAYREFLADRTDDPLRGEPILNEGTLGDEVRRLRR